MDMPFFPGRKPDPPEPMAVFLPPYSEGLGAEFLRRLGKQGGRIVDPFGQSPALALELARSGAAVLLASPNPVFRALLTLQADPPPAQMIRGVLARLGQSPISVLRGPPETLETHIRNLYLGTCAFCGKESEADGYVWAYESEPKPDPQPPREPPQELFQESLEESAPPASDLRMISRICGCPHCNHVVEEPVGPADEKSMPAQASCRMLYHYALQRLAPPEDPHRVSISQALDAYPARSIFALVQILRRLETMEFGPEEKRCIDLLMLSAFDEAHMLRGYGRSARSRPRSLQPPAEFREVNIWRALEKTAADWSLPTRPVPVRKWKEGEGLEPGAIRTFAGSAHDLAPLLKDVRPDAMISFLPRPNLAAWTLAALWAEWLWGRAVSESISRMLHRRRYDWTWHARALGASAAALAANLPAGLPVAGFLGEWEPAFLAAVLWAFYQAGFPLIGRVIRTDTCSAQLLWSAPGPEHTPAVYGPKTFEPAADVARLAVRRLISSRAEPVSWDLLHAAAWSEAAFRHMLPPEAESPKETTLARCQTLLADTIKNDREIKSTTKEESEFGTTWWLPGDETITSPLSDQVEGEIAQTLFKDGPLAMEELDRRICSFFPGLLTPELRLLQACLESYGSPVDGGRAWTLRPEDYPASREEELRLIRGLLGGLGEKMGFALEGNDELAWIDRSGRKAYCFAFTATAAVGRFLLQKAFEPRRSWIVLPGGRATLVGYKLRRNVLLRRAVSDGWRFLKFRHIRRLLEDPLLGPDTLEERMGLDPLDVTEDRVPYW